jgi:hypothetical protein
MSGIRIQLSTPDLKLSYHGSQEFFDRVLGPVLDPLRGGAGEPARRRPTPVLGEAPPRDDGYHPPSDRFGVFQRQLDPAQTEPASRLAAYAFFLWNYEKKETFGEGEIEGCFRADGVEPPEDAGPVYGDLITRRMLAPGAKERTWRLTGKGRDYVRRHLLSS